LHIANELNDADCSLSRLVESYSSSFCSPKSVQPLRAGDLTVKWVESEFDASIAGFVANTRNPHSGRESSDLVRDQWSPLGTQDQTILVDPTDVCSVNWLVIASRDRQAIRAKDCCSEID
jgi:hypothetical protein